jgi:hypothetical protein
MKLSWKSTSRPAVAMAVALFVGAAFAPTPASADRWKDKGGHRGPKKHATVYCPAPVVRHAPRYVYTEPCSQPVIYVSRRPFYEYRQLGMYVPQSWINVQIGNRAPRGYVFYDPYCHRTFSTLARFRAHKRGPGHMVALDIVAVDDLRWEGRNAYYARDYEECGYDDGRYNDYGDDRNWDDRDRTRWSVSAQINVD